MSTIPNDPVMLLSFLNTKLRDEYHSLTKLCDDLGLNKNDVLLKMMTIDYRYDPNIKQFK